jgi:uncharacterized membrane protein YkvA (DUF1232 family)
MNKPLHRENPAASAGDGAVSPLPIQTNSLGDWFHDQRISRLDRQFHLLGHHASRRQVGQRPNGNIGGHSARQAAASCRRCSHKPLLAAIKPFSPWKTSRVGWRGRSRPFFPAPSLQGEPSMEDFIFWMAVLVGLFIFVIMSAPAIAALAHQKQKKEKLELLKQYPHAATEILRSIDQQEARFKQGIDQYGDNVRNAFESKPKAGGGAGKFVVVALCLIYIVCPIDFIPDVIPVLGWGDDVAAAIIGFRALVK